MPFDVKETTLPGIGKKYEVYLDANRSIAIVIETSGNREVFVRDHPDDDYERVATFTDSQARTIGLFLVGAYYQPVAGDIPEETSAGDHIEWYAVGDDSPLAGRTIGELDIEAETGVTILGIERDGTVQSVPESAFEFRGGDRLIVVASSASHAALDALLAD